MIGFVLPKKLASDDYDAVIVTERVDIINSIRDEAGPAYLAR